jgi:hypothetical protein
MNFIKQLLIIVLVGSLLSTGATLKGKELQSEKENRKNIGVRVAPKDAFPVFDNPEFVSGFEATEKGYVHPGDPVIGLVIDRKAKAYPIKTMGIHELGNDTLGGIPIAVSW